MKNIERHLIFWLGMLIALSLLFGSTQAEYIKAFYFSCLLLPQWLIFITTIWYLNFFIKKTNLDSTSTQPIPLL